MVRRVLAIAFCCVAVMQYSGNVLAGESPKPAGDRHSVSTYPVKPVRLIVTFPPGSGADAVGRIVGQKLTELLGQQVVIDNRAGAGGNIGTAIAARAEPDGYTVVMCATALVIGPSLYGSLPYDPIKDFAPVTLVVSLPFMLVVNSAVPARSVSELIQVARSRPGQLSYASIGSGTMQQIAAELFKSMARVDIVHIPYRGTGQYLPDLMNGRVSMMFSGMPPVLPHVKTGKLRALAVTTATRSPAAPDIPTIAESGLDGYEANVWFGVLAPIRTPTLIINRLNELIVGTLHMKDVKEKLLAQGVEPVGNKPEEFGAIIKSDMAKYAKTVKDANIHLD